MSSQKKTIILAAALLVAVWQGVFAQNEEDATVRAQKIARLVAMVEDENLAQTDRSKVVAAIQQLGEMRAHVAAVVLAEKLDFHVNKEGIIRHNEPPSPDEEYPAVRALIQIGDPAVPSVIGAVAANERSPLFLRNAAYTIIKITGGEEAAQKLVADAAKERLKKAERIQKFSDLLKGTSK